MMKRVLVCLACVVLTNVCAALDQAQFDADVCYMTNRYLNGVMKHVRDVVYPGLDGFQKRRGLSDEDFTRELLFIASIKRLDGSEDEREKRRKTLAWVQTIGYLERRSVPLKEAIDFYERILRNGTEDEVSDVFPNYTKFFGYTPEYLEKMDAVLKEKEERNNPTRNTLLFCLNASFNHALFWSRPPISNVESNRIVEYMEKSVRKDSARAGYFLDTLCKAKPEFQDSDEWFERVRAITADGSLSEPRRQRFRDQLREAEKRRKALRASGEAEKRGS